MVEAVDVVQPALQKEVPNVGIPEETRGKPLFQEVPRVFVCELLSLPCFFFTSSNAEHLGTVM